MTLTDTGPLVAMLDVRDQHHAQAAALIDRVAAPLTTTEACLTECLHLLGSISGWRGQSSLWHLVRVEMLLIVPPADDSLERAQNYMERYQDQPCDYADATPLIAAEDMGEREIWTLDRHFYAYRMTNGRHLQIIE